MSVSPLARQNAVTFALLEWFEPFLIETSGKLIEFVLNACGTEHERVIPIGIGSGSTVVLVVEQIAALLSNRSTILSQLGIHFVFIPTSQQSAELIDSNRLNRSDLNRFPTLAVAFDGADEIDSRLSCIKGGGGCLFQEKVVASCSLIFIIVGEVKKKSKCLGTFWKSVPVGNIITFCLNLINISIYHLQCYFLQFLTIFFIFAKIEMGFWGFLFLSLFLIILLM